MRCLPRSSNGQLGVARRRASPMSVLLQVRRLSVSYGKVEALHSISLDVREGTIVTVIGPNGAGKTTLLSAIIGLLASRGEIDYDGAQLAISSVEERVAAGLVLVPEKRELFAGMTVADNLELGAFVRRRSRDAMSALHDVYRRFPRLSERKTQLAA